jgi:peptide/nickel transport system permease protein
VVRGEVLVQRELDYVASAKIIGFGPWPILWREILPNVAPLLLTLWTLEMGIAVVVEAILSFVGLGVSSDAASWGSMIADGRIYINQAWWLLALPVACVILVVLGFNALGDGLRDRLDPLRRAAKR